MPSDSEKIIKGHADEMKFFVKYEEMKNSMFQLDFDDLLIYTIKILETNEDIKEKWTERFQHILVDEFQDTNDLQFKLLTLITDSNSHEVPKDNYFYGIPFVAKDNFSTKDIESTGGSNILKGYIPLFDATVIKYLKDAKAILIGKTTLDELAMGGSGTSGHKGLTFNPYDKTHTHMIGGSSCGSAAAVASSIVPFALGSDTGDSVRKPASFSALVGMKEKIKKRWLF